MKNIEMSKMYVAAAVKYMTENYKTAKIRDTAEHIGINRSYLCGIFKNEMGIPPQRFLIDYRMELGCRLLVETNDSITEVSHQIGYENPLTFSKSFKIVYGMCPSAYRKLNKTPVNDD